MSNEPTEKAKKRSQEKLLRQAYCERYSKEIVDWAVKKASAHRARAQRKYGKTEHFTAYEWLDLCAAFGFRCITCRAETPLEPHHRLDMSHGGTNTIENIEPICRQCHSRIHPGSLEMAEIWLSQEEALCRLFREGDTVTFNHNLKKRPGVIIEIIPAQAGAGPLAGYLHSGEVTLACHSLQYWAASKALIRWPRGVYTYMATHCLSELKKID